MVDLLEIKAKKNNKQKCFNSLLTQEQQRDVLQRVKTIEQLMRM